MLPSLILLLTITGSRRESDIERPPLLEGGFPPLIKAFTAALRRCSSSISLFLRRRMKKKTAPPTAATAKIPHTTPTAMPTVLVPLDSSSGVAVGLSAPAVGVIADMISIGLNHRGEKKKIMKGRGNYLSNWKRVPQ